MKKTKFTYFIFILACTIIFITACGSEQPQYNSGTPNYKELKSMVLDILNTEDGQKAVKEAALETSEADLYRIQMLSSPQGQQIQMAVKDVLTDPRTSNVIQQLMKDPKFAGEFAQVIQTQNKEIHKDLMKDPDYQQSMIDIMKDKNFETIIVDIMKGPDYRQQMMTIIQEALDNPLFKPVMLDLMKKALEDDVKPKKDEETGMPSKGSSETQENEGNQQDQSKEKEEQEGNQDEKQKEKEKEDLDKQEEENKREEKEKEEKKEKEDKDTGDSE